LRAASPSAMPSSASSARLAGPSTRSVKSPVIVRASASGIRRTMRTFGVPEPAFSRVAFACWRRRLRALAAWSSEAWAAATAFRRSALLARYLRTTRTAPPTAATATVPAITGPT